jgi:peptidyl-dipeptidase A
MSGSHFAGGAVLALVAMALTGRSGTARAEEQSDARARAFVAMHEAAIRPMEIEVGRRWWDANTSGKEDVYRRKEEAETRLELRLADPKVFAELKAIHAGQIKDPLLARQIQVIYLQYLAKQVDPELLKRIVLKSNAIERAFNVYRPKLKGKELTDNEVRRILRESKDSAERQAVWESSKGVGRIVEKDLKELIKLRNEAARKLGFDDFHKMQLHLGEQSQEQVLRLFDELDGLTREPFRQAKAEIDGLLAADCGIAIEQLRPWHYHDPFCQESPAVFGTRNEALYQSIDILKTCRAFYAGIGLPVDDVIGRSDLYEKPGKNPHAFCVDIDRAGDVRVLCNIVPGREWLATSLHELGHSVYSSKNIPPSVPYVLRCESHALTTEGVAMMFERFADNPAWLQAMGVAVPEPEKFGAAARKVRRNQMLIFSRWCQVMLRFEKELYGNPDQDLNKLWWDLVEKYQEVKRPPGRNEPDYAAKIHIIIAPVYYHNYQMGELFASQVHHALVREVLKRGDAATAAYVGNKGAGRFMVEKVFVPGRSLSWNQLTRHATGEELNPKAFAEDLKRP